MEVSHSNTMVAKFNDTFILNRVNKEGGGGGGGGTKR